MEDFYNNLTFYLENYGCQMNKADSNSLMNLLFKEGFKQTENYENSNAIIINTCSVRAHAEERVFSRVRLFKSYKRKEKKDIKIIVIGCMAQTSKDFLISIGADKVFDVYNENLVIDYIKEKELNITKFNGEYIFNSSYTDEKRKHKAFLPITHGCDNWCTYCIVPHTRGHMVSRKSIEVIEEVKKLIDLGAKEITLLGQNVNSYGTDLKDISFVDLLYEIDKVIGKSEMWVRFMTSHPKDFDKTLAEAVWNINSVCKHVHLPFQSASNRILKLMNRKYTVEDYIKKVSFLRDYDPLFALSTDVLVGFADETEEEFEETLELLKQIGFEEAYLYRYSEREGSIAHKKNMKYDEKKGKERLSKLVNFQRVIAENILTKHVGSIASVMVDDMAKDNVKYQTRSKENRIILIDSQKKLNMGDIYKVKITGIKSHTLIGEIL